jgi:uncharacterized protein (TIGR00369 family)
METPLTPERALRHRSYEWTPIEGSGAPLADCTGLQFFTDLRDGIRPMPPIACTVGWSVDEVEVGRVRLKLLPQEYLMHGADIMHGGVTATLLDSAMAAAMMTTLPQGRGCTTLQANVNFLRMITPKSGLLACVGISVQSGRQTGSAEATLTNAEGQIYARGTSIFLIFDI